jgi:uncharacterized protein
VIIDASALVALLDISDHGHQACCAAMAERTAPMPITMPVLTEAMFLVSRGLGRLGPARVWAMVESGVIEPAYLDDALLDRCRVLMLKYRSIPMSLADASIVALAEALDDDEVFTLDSDFEVYRMHGRRRMRVVP